MKLLLYLKIQVTEVSVIAACIFVRTSHFTLYYKTTDYVVRIFFG